MSFGFVLTCTVLVELYVLRRLRFDGITIGLVIAGSLLCVNYLTYTSVAERNYDASSQLEYIRAIASDWRLPNVYGCGACGHPPGYYALAALWSKLWQPASWLPTELGLQWLSLLSFFGFIVTALLIFRSCSLAPSAFRLATLLVVLWPSGIINSVRVHNDALAAPLTLAGIYFLAEWDRRTEASDFYKAVALTALALCTKASAYPLAFCLLGFVVWRLRAPAVRRERFRLCAIAIIAVAAAAVVPMAIRESKVPTTLCQKIVGLGCDGRYVPPVADTPGRFVKFDPAAFVNGLAAAELPPSDPFLNRVATSSLVGLMPLGDELSGRRQRLLAPLMGILLLLMAACCAAALPFVRRAWVEGQRVYCVTALVMLAFLVAFRVRAPNEFHEDFRHIYPALVPFCLAYVSVVERVGRASRLLRSGGVAIAVAMAACSTAFFARTPTPNEERVGRLDDASPQLAARPAAARPALLFGHARRSRASSHPPSPKEARAREPA